MYQRLKDVSRTRQPCGRSVPYALWNLWSHSLHGSAGLTSIRIFCRILLSCLSHNFAQNVTSSSADDVITSQTFSIGLLVRCETSTCSSAVAKRVMLRCFNNTYLERSFFLLLVTSASDLSVRTIRFCFVVFGVTSSHAVIHTIAVVRDCV